MQKFTGKMANANPGSSILCKPEQSKCTWTCHKRNFVRKFTRKMPDASDTTSIENRPLTVTVRTPQCGHAVWRTYFFLMFFLPGIICEILPNRNCLTCFTGNLAQNCRRRGIQCSNSSALATPYVYSLSWFKSYTL